MVLQRLENYQKRLMKNQNLRDSYTKVIEQYLAKGYIRSLIRTKRNLENSFFNIFLSFDQRKPQPHSFVPTPIIIYNIHAINITNYLFCAA